MGHLEQREPAETSPDTQPQTGHFQSPFMQLLKWQGQVWEQELSWEASTRFALSPIQSLLAFPPWQRKLIVIEDKKGWQGQRPESL